MSNGEKKPGEAAADRVRERTNDARKRYQESVKDVFGDFEEKTQPRLFVHRMTSRPRITVSKTDSVFPGLSRVPRRIRPYVVGAILALALVGAGVNRDWLMGMLARLAGVP